MKNMEKVKAIPNIAKANAAAKSIIVSSPLKSPTVAVEVVSVT